MRPGFVYIMTNRAGTLYIGVTNNLERRVMEQKAASVPSFTAQYRMTQLVYYEAADDIHDAIARQKQLKGWTRRRKVELVDQVNPHWFDLSDGLAGASSFTEPAPSLHPG